MHQEYMADLVASTKHAIDTIDPSSFFAKYRENVWAATRELLDATAAAAAKPVIEKYTGVLAAADVFTESTAYLLMQALRFDLGYGSRVRH